MVHTMVNTVHFPSMMSNYGKEYMYINLGQIEKDKFQSIIQKHEKARLNAKWMSLPCFHGYLNMVNHG